MFGCVLVVFSLLILPNCRSFCWQVIQQSIQDVFLCFVRKKKTSTRHLVYNQFVASMFSHDINTLTYKQDSCAEIVGVTLGMDGPVNWLFRFLLKVIGSIWWHINHPIDSIYRLDCLEKLVHQLPSRVWKIIPTTYYNQNDPLIPAVPLIFFRTLMSQQVSKRWVYKLVITPMCPMYK